MSNDQELEFMPFAVSVIDAQFIEFRRFQLEEICMVFSGAPAGSVVPQSTEDAA